ncbi:MAG: hypothetical protein QOE17_1524 [Gaiellales bacterium]|nr:hypothetical protein [Gaiellales bacterium]
MITAWNRLRTLTTALMALLASVGLMAVIVMASSPAAGTAVSCVGEMYAKSNLVAKSCSSEASC